MASGWTFRLDARSWIVALDYPRWVSLGRLVRQTLARVAGGDPICNETRETLRRVFSRESLIIWHFRSFSRKRRRMRTWAADTSGPRVMRFTSPREAEAWLRQMMGESRSELSLSRT